jgi:3-phosphoshikimate 1-carboxyvinyltransferase
MENPVLDAAGDHRIAMLASVLSLHAGGRIRDADCVSKSNSGFFRDLAAMGGDIKLVQ